MYEDEIIAEVWRNRDAYAAQHNNDIARIAADLRKLQQRSGWRIVDRSQSTSSPSNSDIQHSSNHPNDSVPFST